MAVVVGTELDDTLTGTNQDDSLFGRAGNDTLSGLDGNDSLFGEAGNDIINGDDGNDRLFGGDGNDSINGGNGINVIFGGNGDDSLSSGFDITGGNSSIFGGNGNNSLTGGYYDDRLYGENGNDTLFGFYGDDTLNGGAGNDTLEGSFIFAGNESDRLTGGTGEDTFILGGTSFGAVSPFYSSNGNEDYALIIDFNQSEDVIRLQEFSGDLSSNSFVTVEYRLGASPETLPSGTAIYADNLGANPELIAILQGVEPNSLSLAEDYFQFFATV